MGGGRGSRVGLGRRLARGPGHRIVTTHDQRRVARSQSTGDAAYGRSGTHPPAWSGSAPIDEDRSGVVGGPGVAPGTRDAGRSHVPAPLDLQEYPALGRGTDADEPSRGATDRGGIAPRVGI